MSLDDILKDLQKDYIAGIPAKIANLQNLLNQENWTQLKDEFHKMKGTGKTYGIPELSLIAQQVEQKINAKNGKQLTTKAIALIEATQHSRIQGHAFDAESSSEYQELLRA